MTVADRPRDALSGRPFDRDQALAAGSTPEELTRLVRDGLLRRVLRGVYIDASAPDDVSTRAAALHLVLPRGAVVSRLTAAWLWGADARGPEALGEPVPVECTVPVGQPLVRRRGIRAYTAPLDGDSCELDGIAVTTPERTVLDLLRWHPAHLALGAADAFAARGLVTADALLLRVEAFAGTRGVRQARRLAGLVEPLTESVGESWTRLRIVDAGFPRPQPQIPVRDGAGRVVHRLDLGWKDRRIAVEYDGEEFHSTPRQRAHDVRRREQLEHVYGWTILAVGRGEVLGRSLAFERAVGELLGLAPTIRRRSW